MSPKQPILSSDPFYVHNASKDGRLFLARTKGSLSSGTRVTLIESDPGYSILRVVGKTRIRTEFRGQAPEWKDATEEVVVSLDDLVIRRMACHPDSLNPNQPKPRSVRRKEMAARLRVLEQLQNKGGT